MKSKGRIYLVTDVSQYFEYTVPIFKEHPIFDEIYIKKCFFFDLIDIFLLEHALAKI